MVLRESSEYLRHLTLRFVNRQVKDFRQQRRAVSRVIPFYVPKSFRLPVKVQEVPSRSLAKVIEFRPSAVKKPA
jgi:hypothetical protein